MFNHPDYDGHEALLFTRDAASGLRALIAIHDTTLGPAFGGCRMYPYASEQHAMTDVLRLSRGMTYKAAICELPYGGGKSVVIADPRRDRTHGGRAASLARDRVRRVRGPARRCGDLPRPQRLGGAASRRPGAGQCRYAIVRLLVGGGAALVVSDLDGNRCAQAAATYGATLAAPEEIHAQHVDVFVPAALGAVLNDATIPGLRCRVVCGGANNQLAEARHDAALAVRGIVFGPDYLANACVVIDVHQETIDDQPAAVLASVARIGAITRGVLRCAAATGATPLSVADHIVRARIIRRA